MTTTSKTEYEAAFEAGRAAAGFATIDAIGIPYAALPPGYQAENLERFLARPVRTRARTRFVAAPSFTAYVNDFKQTETLLFADVTARTLTAALDYDGAGEPSWREHSAVLALEFSTEWKAWAQHHRKPLGQVDFAEHLEDNAGDIIDPDAAQVIECARHLEASKSAAFTSGQSLRDGSIQLRYEESVTAAVGSASVPERFKLRLPIFRGGPEVEVEVRLRFRIKERALTFIYLIDRIDRVVEDAFAGAVTEVEKATGLVALYGSVG